MSRRSARGQDSLAISVSNAITVSAAAAGSGSPIIVEGTLDVRAIGVALRLVLVEQIIIAVGHAEPGREHAADVHRRIGEVGQHADAEQGLAEIAVRPAMKLVNSALVLIASTLARSAFSGAASSCSSRASSM